MPHSPGMFVLALASCVALLAGCASGIEIRLQNVSPLDFTEVSVAGKPYGDLPAGATSEYHRVKLRFRYALVRLTADGVPVNAQTLNLGSKRFTHRIDVADLAAGHLDVEVVRD